VLTTNEEINMKQALLKKALIAGIAVALPVLSTGVASADTVKLRMANWLPPVHHMSATLRAWADELQAASGDELEIEVMTAPLAKPNGQYDLVKNGVVDMAYGVAAYHPKRFWRLQAVETPFAAPNAETAGVAAWRWYEKHGFMAEDTSDSKLLALFAHAPHLYHSAKPLESIDDFKNLKIRVGGNGVKIAEILGAVPVSMPPGQTQEAMTKGTIDVSQFPWESVAGFGLADVSSHHLVVPGGTYAGIFYLTMSSKTWDKLSDSQKAAVEKVSGEWGSRFLSQKWDAAEQAGLDAATKAGNTITTLSDADTAKLREMVQPITDEWVQKADDAGLDGKALIEDFYNTVSDL
jgi:TRAP-type C4-dicarboxylate transport system substrate-binding protein